MRKLSLPLRRTAAPPAANGAGIKRPLTAAVPAKTTGDSKVDAMFARARVEAKKAAERKAKGDLPWRVRLSVGETRRIIIVQDKPWCTYEHNWKNAEGKWRNFEVCIKEKGLCPLCQKLEREGYYV
jgi:hypothetical protein